MQNRSNGLKSLRESRDLNSSNCSVLPFSVRLRGHNRITQISSVSGELSGN